MSWYSRKVFVTGAGGFIGSHLVPQLLRLGADVTAMLHYNSRSDWNNLEFLSEEEKRSIRVVKGNIEDAGFIDREIKNQDIVFHLAALIGIPYSYSAPLSYVQTNIVGTINILEAARKFDIQRVIHTSTSETYGTAIYTPIDEKHPLQAQSPYSASKIGADMMAESYYRSFNIPVSILRPFNTFGPRQSARAIIPTVISQILSGKNKIVLGSLSPVRDLTYVKDTVQGFINIANTENSIGQVVNVGYGKGISMRKLVELIMEIMGITLEIVEDESRIRPEKSEVMELVCDNSRAAEMIDWVPRISLRDGLDCTIRFLEKNLERYKKDHYIV